MGYGGYRAYGRRSRAAAWRPYLVAIVILVLIVGAVLWRLPSGEGEYQAAPSGAYTAHLSHLSRGTWGFKRADYAEARVVDAKGNILWQMTYAPQTPLPDYGDRQKHFIKWAASSTSVTFFFDGAASDKAARVKVTVPTP